MSGRIGPADLIDTSYPMRLIGDTAGGFWGESAGSWLHINAEGNAVARFNVEPPMAFWRVSGIAALSPTTLLVTTSGSGSLYRFDTEAGTWEAMLEAQEELGDLAVHGSTVYFVASATSDPTALGDPTFTVKRWVVGSTEEPVDVTPEIPGSRAVAIDTRLDGTLFIATERERLIVAPSGEVVERLAVSASVPEVDVSEDGVALWSGTAEPDGHLEHNIDGGSAEARSVIDTHLVCDPDVVSLRSAQPDRLTIAAGTEGSGLPFLCAPAGFVWVTDDTFVVSVGNEGGASLVRVTPPQ